MATSGSCSRSRLAAARSWQSRPTGYAGTAALEEHELALRHRSQVPFAADRERLAITRPHIHVPD